MEKSSNNQQIFKKGDSLVRTVKSYLKVDSLREAVNHDTPRSLPSSLPTGSELRQTKNYTKMCTKKSTKTLLKPPIKSKHKIDRIVTDVGLQSRLASQVASPSQCWLPMTENYKRYCSEHLDALHEGSTETRPAWTWYV